MIICERGRKYNWFLALEKAMDDETVLQTDTGELVEYTKVNERKILKELGKITS